MSAALAQVQAELILTVMSGPDKGANYKIVSTKITLGRATNNSIVVKDPRCSRHHATIELTSGGIFITDTSSQNSIEVDGVVTKKAQLKSGSYIKLGATTLKLEARSQIPQLIPNAPSGTTTFRPRAVAPSNPRQQAAAGKRNFYVIVGIAAIGLILLLKSTSSKNKKEVPIRNDAQIQEEIKASQERRDAIAKQQEQKGVGTPEYAEMQATYLQGFRDYREGNYGRALLSFDAVLALNPKHELAFKYRELSKRKQDELIELTMLEGKRYMEQNKYALARNAYQQVMILIGDPKNKLYLEAREYFTECLLLMKGAY